MNQEEFEKWLEEWKEKRRQANTKIRWDHKPYLLSQDGVYIKGIRAGFNGSPVRNPYRDYRAHGRRITWSRGYLNLWAEGFKLGQRLRYQNSLAKADLES